MITKNVGSFRFVCGMGMNRGSLILVGPPQVERLGIWQPAKQYSPFADGDKDRSQSASPAPSGYPLFSTSASMYQRRPTGPFNSMYRNYQGNRAAPTPLYAKRSSLMPDSGSLRGRQGQ